MPRSVLIPLLLLLGALAARAQTAPPAENLQTARGEGSLLTRVRGIFDLDLPDAIELRRRFFSDSERCRMIAGSVLDTGWFDTVAASPGPYLFLCEAVLIYLSREEVRRVLTQLSQRFPGSLIAFDTAGRRMVDNQDRNRSLAQVSARLQWVCDDPREIEGWGPQLIDTRTLAKPQPEIAKTWPPQRRYGMPLLARLAPSMVNTYKFNLFRLPTTS